MIDALISGKLFAKPEQRTGSTGRPFATCKIRVATGEDSIFVSVIAFDAGVVHGLMALDAGDSVSLSGELTPKVFVGKNGEAKPAIDFKAHAIATPYHVMRKRQAMQPDDETRKRRAMQPDDDRATANQDDNDDIPF